MISQFLEAKSFIEDLIKVWQEERPTQLAAALAYYGMFSFAPVIYISITIASYFISDAPIMERLFNYLETLLGSDATDFVATLVETLSQTSGNNSWIINLISSSVLLYTASGLFFQLQYALNRIWNTTPPLPSKPIALIIKRVFYISLVIGIGLILVVAAMGNIAISWLSSALNLSTNLPIVSFLILFALLSFSIALIYKVLPDVKVTWLDVSVGSVLTSILILFGGYLIGAYFRIINFGSAFQAASAFVIIIVSMYYIAQIFLFGAIFTRIFASKYGSLKPDHSIN